MDEEENLSDLRSLIDTFAKHNGNLNFRSPLLKALREEVGGDLICTPYKSWRCHTHSNEINTPPNFTCNIFQGSRSSIHHNQTADYSYTPDSDLSYRPYISGYSHSYTSNSDIAITGKSTDTSTSTYNSATTTSSESMSPEIPPSKRLKLSNDSYYKCTSVPRFGVMNTEENSDLGVAPLTEVFCPCAASTPLSSPRHMAPSLGTMNPEPKLDQFSFVVPMDTVERRHARRRLFVNEDEEAVHYLVTKYLNVK